MSPYGMLFACPLCRRHVRVGSSECPFCRATGAALLAGSLAIVGCGGSSEPAPEPGEREISTGGESGTSSGNTSNNSNGGRVNPGEVVAMYGAPPAPPPDAEDSSDSNGAPATLYGGPPSGSYR